MIKKILVGVVGVLMATTGIFSNVAAVETREMIFEWATGTPTTVPNGSRVVASLFVNLNDDKGADGSASLISSIVLENGTLNFIPDACSGSGSSLVNGGTVLNCDFGTVSYGTAKQIDLDITANGLNGSLLTATAGVPNADVIQLSPISITATAGIDIITRTSVGPYRIADDEIDYGFVVPYAITIPRGTEMLSDSVEFDIKISNSSGQPASDILYYYGNGGNTYYSDIPRTGDSFPIPNNVVVTKTSADTWHVVMSVRDTIAPTPTTDASGNLLPTDRLFLQGGSFYFRNNQPVFLPGGGSFSFTTSIENVQATTLSGLIAPEVDYSNQSTNHVGLRYTSWSSGWLGANSIWDGSIRTIANEVRTFAVSSSINIGNDKRKGICTVLDPIASRGEFESLGTANLQGATIPAEYYTGPIDNNFDCGIGTWTTTPPTDKSTIRAIRYILNPGDFDSTNSDYNDRIRMVINYKVLSTSPGDDIWAWGQLMDENGNWNRKFITDPNDPLCITPVGGRYYCTTARQDYMEIVGSRVSSSKTVSKAIAESGEVVQFELGYAVQAPIPTFVGSVKITDILPKEFQYVDYSASLPPTSITKNGNGDTVLVWEVSNMMPNTDYNISYSAKAVGTPGRHVNRVTVENMSPGAIPGEQGYSSTSTVAVNIPNKGETILLKQAGSSEFAVNQSNEWFIEVKNNDVRPTTVDMIDILPYNGDDRGTSYVGTYTVESVSANGTVYYTSADPTLLNPDPDHSSNGSFGNVTGNAVGWTTTKPANVTGVRVITNDLGAGQIQRTAIIWSTNRIAEDDIFANTAQAKATTTVLKMVKADQATVAKEGSVLRISKEPIGMPVRGEPMSYNITIVNTGTGQANDVEVKDLGGMNVVEGSAVFSDMSQGTFTNGLWNVGILAPGQQASAVVTVDISPDADMSINTVNKALVQNPSHPKDENTACIANSTLLSDTDQCDSAELKPVSNVKLDKVEKSHTYTADGGTIDYTITVKNIGPDTAYDLIVKDLPGIGHNVTDAQEWVIDRLDKDEVRTFDITLPVTDPRIRTLNKATVEGPSNPLDPDSCEVNEDVASDNDQCDIVRVESNGNLKIEKTVVEPTETLLPGSEIVWHITVLNEGPDPIYDVVLRDIVGDGHVLKDEADLEKKVDAILPNEPYTYSITTVVDEFPAVQTLTNSVRGSAHNHPETTTENQNTGAVETDDDQYDVDNIDLNLVSTVEIIKTVNMEEAQVGDVLDYTIWIKNTGNVKMQPTISDPGCEDLIQNTDWLLPDEERIYNCIHTVVAKDELNDIYKNVASVLGNNGIAWVKNPTAKDDALTKIKDILPNITLIKKVDKTTASINETLHYEILVKNTGNVGLAPSITDPMCEGLEQDTSILNPEEERTYFCSHKVTEEDQKVGTYVNTAVVVGDDGFDHTENPIAEDSVITNVNNILLTKTVDKEKAMMGDRLYYTITIKNNGFVRVEPTIVDDGCIDLVQNTDWLFPNEERVYTCKHDVTLADVSTGRYVNVATVIADDKNPATKDLKASDSAETEIMDLPIPEAEEPPAKATPPTNNGIPAGGANGSISYAMLLSGLGFMLMGAFAYLARRRRKE